LSIKTDKNINNPEKCLIRSKFNQIIDR